MARKRAISEVDRAIARLTGNPHGVFTSTQLSAAGVGWSTIDDRITSGVLHRIHRGVYSTVPPRLLRIEGRWLAAVLACGEGAVLSHTAAAALWDLRAIPSGPIHITVPTHAGRRQRRGIAIHRSLTLLPSHVTARREIPVTGPARTLSDLRRMLAPDQIKAVLRRASQQHLDLGPSPSTSPTPTAPSSSGACTRFADATPCRCPTRSR